MQPMQDGSWTKRMHPGLAGASAVTAATFARHGFVGPTEAYEGRFGLYPCFLKEHAKDVDPASAAAELGERWEFPRSSVKLFPACHQSHAFFNAAIAIAREQALNLERIETIRVRIAEPAAPLICEPLASKRKPDSSYAAQFSLPYGIAACLTRRRFGLDELEAASYEDPALLALAHKVDYEIDPNPGFPKFRSGEVIVKTREGQTHSKRENIVPDEPAAEEAIIAKFMDNTAPITSQERAARIRDVVLDLETLTDARALTALLS
jgi:2-methylcitrate dehydratase PrpD